MPGDMQFPGAYCNLLQSAVPDRTLAFQLGPGGAAPWLAIPEWGWRDLLPGCDGVRATQRRGEPGEVRRPEACG
ncbi:hypothetical protein NDU88_001922 [Pleurodeles waltl]|uniref:Uncharacterized protein n=1 Tax=Pleurodeles waltl TaxID=8319 RepID=A0AAV7QA75_PLEWA|nr:hypothetical protein NDU88_001922 [Pleurodeles waltl]